MMDPDLGRDAEDLLGFSNFIFRRSFPITRFLEWNEVNEEEEEKTT